MDPISSFFLWCAGVIPRIIKDNDLNSGKYIALGILVFSTGLLASASGGYAIFFLFGSPKIAIAAGLFWGALIFSFDRFIIMTIKKQDEPFYEFLQMLPRLLLAILISIVIAKPLEMKIFDGEITNEILSMSADRSNDQKARLEQELGIKEIEKELELILAKIDDSKQKLYAEMGGSNGGDPGYGRQAIAIDTIVRREEKQADEIRRRLAEKKDQLEARLSEFTSQFEQGGILRKLDAMDRLSEGSDSIKWGIWAITMLFIVFETGPVIAKALMKRSTYDDKLASDEKSYNMRVTLDFEFQQKLQRKILDERLQLLNDSTTSWKEKENRTISELTKLLGERLSVHWNNTLFSNETGWNSDKNRSWLTDQLNSWLLSAALSGAVVLISYFFTGNFELTQLSGITWLVSTIAMKFDKSNPAVL